MKKKASVEAWAEEVLRFKKHTLSIHETAIVYQRDQEVFTYAFDGIHIHHAPHYLQVLASDGNELLIPKNAFTEEQYERFVQQVNNVQA